MQIRIFLIILCCALSAFNKPTYAGERGYRIIFFDTNKNFENKTLFKQYRKQYDFHKLNSCWKKRNGEWIDTAYVDTAPNSINEKLIYEVQQKQPNAIKKLTTILINYKDDLIESGFDGIYIAEYKSSEVTITGISRSGDMITIKEKSPISLKQFDLMLCKAGKAFDNTFNP